MTFWALFKHFHFKKDRKESIVVLIYRDFLNNMSHLPYFVGSIRGFLVGHMVPKSAKKAENMTFWAFSNIFASNKIEMNPFSSSTNLERLLGEYEPLHVLL